MADRAGEGSTVNPERCPNPECMHASGSPPSNGRFFRRKGSYRQREDRPIARFQCKTCGRHFSEQTLRPGYRDRRPELEAPLRALHRGGFSLRKAAVLLGVSREAVRRRYARFDRERLLGELSPADPPLDTGRR